MNVFPVPDGDTGTNLCLTLRAVAQALRDLGDAPLPHVTATLAGGSGRGARGNSWTLLSQFLLRLQVGPGDRPTAGDRHLARAIGRALRPLRCALDHPAA